ncbi:MAG: acyltransferase [Pseudomonadota bacterium]
MYATNPVFILFPLLSVLATAFFLKKFGDSPVDHGRFVGIDGLRGYLAFFVFVHHAAIWYFYLQIGTWTSPPSALYTNLGQASVALFFMITGFLFYNKLLDARVRGIDWGKFFVSRVLRLLPLYLFMLFCMVTIVAFESKGVLNESVFVIAKSLVKWLSFTILGDPDLNRLNDTWVIVAGVTWSLPYEWFFYLALPVLALTVRTVPPLPYLLLSLAGISWAVLRRIDPPLLMAFGGGIFAALAVRSRRVCKIAEMPVGSILAVSCAVAVVLLFPKINGSPQMILLSLTFMLVAGGATLFGGLASPVSRILGEMAYSMYLLHGILLFITINYVIGNSQMRAMSATSYWMVVTAISPLLIIICHVTCRTIELPAMRQATKLTAWLRSFWKRTAQPSASISRPG